MRALRRRLAHARWVQVTIGVLGAHYLRLVWSTTRFVIEPRDIYERVDRDYPVILAMWHGQHFLGPFVKRPQDRAKVLISRHRDGEVNAVAAERLGIGTVRGSGNHGGEFSRKGGVAAFVAMVAALKEGYNMALTADVPKVGRVAGLGIVMLARRSGRPIYPIAIATQHRFEVDNWDRSAINLPFGRGAVVVAEPVRVPADADDATLEGLRSQVESALNKATARAYAIVDRTGRDAGAD
ncbi:MAG: lysophospholipid acyltransferase family protein [Xanthobacteraceae bacterium]|jgi:lysophospholipid acyltransferase (LPLAT)-like uncharacterized protein